MSEHTAHIVVSPMPDQRDALLAPHAPSYRVYPPYPGSWGTLVGEPGDVRHAIHLGGSCPVDAHVHLVLARDHAVVPAGVFRLWWVLRESGVSVVSFDSLLGMVTDALRGHPEALASLRAVAGSGVKCLDEAGRIARAWQDRA